MVRRKKKIDEDAVVRLYRECRTLDEIVAITGASKSAAAKIVRDRVPKAERNEINAKVRRRVNAEYYRADPQVAQDASVPDTWAGAFRALATWCRDNGHEAAWQYAREMAKAKGVRL